MKHISLFLLITALLISSLSSIPFTHPAEIALESNHHSLPNLSNDTNTGNNLDTPIPFYPNKTVDIRIVRPTRDINKNKISDAFETSILDRKNQSQTVDLIIALDHAPTQNDIITFEKHGGIVLGTWDELVYALHGKILKQHIHDYLENDEIVLIEKNEHLSLCLDYSVKQIGVRPTVWNSYGYLGDTNQAIAILDTGIDDSHADLNGKIIAWNDFTSDTYIDPTDKAEHGTHCAGIAAGTGLTSGTSTKKYTWSGTFHDLSTLLINDVYPTKTGTLSLKLNWDDDGDDGDGTAFLWIDKNKNGDIDAGEYISGIQPLTYLPSVTSGQYTIGVAAYDIFSSYEDYYCQIIVPTQTIGDGHYLLSGIAPNCKLAGLKVFTDDEESTSDIIIAALNWLIENAEENNIILASMSIQGPQSDILDTAVNNLVLSGVPCVVSAGNDQGTEAIGSPGTAAQAITVGAVNDNNQLTDYSSLGDPSETPLKPDVLAPGGSHHYGDHIISIDSNDADITHEIDADEYPNDYQAMLGTSMACPHVTGVAALIADALGTWNYTAEQALKVKQIICMTSYEIEQAEDPAFIPSFDHGEKDNKEGYGRVCADAAIEAATLHYSTTQNTFSFGAQPSDKKVWARKIPLTSGSIYTFQLNVPQTGNYDLYLYDAQPDAHGEPILLNASYNTGSLPETITYTCPMDGTYYIIAKWRSGTGLATLQFQGPPPRCTFNYEPSHPTIVDQVNFTDTSDDDTIMSWLWKFGDGATSTVQNPSHTYTQKRTYQVNLTVTNHYGDSNHTVKNLTIVNIPPQASFTYLPLHPTTQDVVLFTDTSVDPDGSLTGWKWSFGDGSSSTIRHPTHTYTNNGNYTVTLNVTDNNQSTHKISKKITVNNTPPTADYAYQPANPRTADTIQFTDVSTDLDGTIVAWFWRFGDGGTSAIKNPTHRYTNSGTYTVTLNVTDDDGGYSQKSKTILVRNTPPTANFSYTPSNPQTNDIIQFTDTSLDIDGTIVTWSWKFGDGRTSSQQNPTHEYSQNRDYTITLNVTDNTGGKNEISKSLTVRNTPPVADFTFNPINPDINETVFFISTSSDPDGSITNYTWDFGDGTKDYKQNPTHHYSDYESYGVSLTITDNDGESDTIQQTILVSPNSPPYTPHNPSPTNGQNKIPVNVTLSWTGGDPNYDTVTYDVYFGLAIPLDKKTSNQSSTVYSPGVLTFDTPYYWRIVAWDTHDATSSSPTWTFTTRGTHPPVATPDSYDTSEDTLLSVAAPGVLANDNDSDGDPLRAVKVSTPLHGTLTMNSNGSFTYTPHANFYGTDIFTYKAYDGYNYSAVVNVSITIHPVNDAPVFGTPTPRNGSTGSSLSLVWSIPITDVEGDLITWTIQCSNGQSNNSADETNGTKTLSLSGLTYSKIYTIWVNATDTAGSNLHTRRWYTIRPMSPGGGGGGGGGGIPPEEPLNQKPIADVSAGEPYQGYVNSEVLFDGSNSYDSDGTITTWFWMFGDTTNGSGRTIRHTYANAGTYTVTLTVTDDAGATHSAVTTCVITQPNQPPTRPTISGPIYGTKNTRYEYTAVSTDADNDTLRYLTIWGDETSYVNTSPMVPSGVSVAFSHHWTTAGIYTIEIRATDNHTESPPGYITILIDVKYVKELGYLIDQNADGLYDLFYSNSTMSQTFVQKQADGMYLLDTDGDGDWDYSYNPATSTLTIYTSQTPGFELIIIFFAIATIIFLKRKEYPR